MPFPPGNEKDRGIPARAQDPEQLKDAIFYKFSAILKAQENSLWVPPERIVNNTSKLKGTPAGMPPVRWRVRKRPRERRMKT